MVSPICNSCSECLCDLGQVSYFGAVKIFAYFSRFFFIVSQVAEVLTA